MAAAAWIRSPGWSAQPPANLGSAKPSTGLADRAWTVGLQRQQAQAWRRLEEVAKGCLNGNCFLGQRSSG